MNIADFCRVGEVVEVNASTVRVKFADADDMVSGELQVLQRKTRDDKDFWMPDLQEQVWCLFLGNGPVAGLVLGATYNAKDKPPENSEGKWVKEFKDGTRFEYDRADNKLDLYIKGDVTVRVEKDKSVKVDGDIDMKANGNFSVDASAAKFNCAAVNLGNGANLGVIHASSPCPIFGVVHLNPSNVTKTAP